MSVAACRKFAVWDPPLVPVARTPPNTKDSEIPTTLALTTLWFGATLVQLITNINSFYFNDSGENKYFGLYRYSVELQAASGAGPVSHYRPVWSGRGCPDP